MGVQTSYPSQFIPRKEALPLIQALLQAPRHSGLNRYPTAPWTMHTVGNVANGRIEAWFAHPLLCLIKYVAC